MADNGDETRGLTRRYVDRFGPLPDLHLADMVAVKALPTIMERALRRDSPMTDEELGLQEAPGPPTVI